MLRRRLPVRRGRPVGQVLLVKMALTSLGRTARLVAAQPDLGTDLVICANERQRDLLIGGMALHGLLDPELVDRRTGESKIGRPGLPVNKVASGKSEAMVGALAEMLKVSDPSEFDVKRSSSAPPATKLSSAATLTPRSMT